MVVSKGFALRILVRISSWYLLMKPLMQYRAEIDGLRALAVIPVILYHAGFKMFGGGICWCWYILCYQRLSHYYHYSRRVGGWHILAYEFLWAESKKDIACLIRGYLCVPTLRLGLVVAGRNSRIFEKLNSSIHLCVQYFFLADKRVLRYRNRIQAANTYLELGGRRTILFIFSGCPNAIFAVGQASHNRIASLYICN